MAALAFSADRWEVDTPLPAERGGAGERRAGLLGGAHARYHSQAGKSNISAMAFRELDSTEWVCPNLFDAPERIRTCDLRFVGTRYVGVVGPV